MSFLIGVLVFVLGFIAGAVVTFIYSVDIKAEIAVVKSGIENLFERLEAVEKKIKGVL